MERRGEEKEGVQVGGDERGEITVERDEELFCEVREMEAERFVRSKV